MRNPIHDFMRNPAASAAAKRQIEAERLRRQSSVSAERNARASQERAAEFLEELRATEARHFAAIDAEPRIAALLAVVSEIVTNGAAALKRYDGHVETLVGAEERYRAAKQAHEAANDAHGLGSLDAQEAIELARRVEIARAALRVRDRELTHAQRPAVVPTVGLPREAVTAAEATRDLEGLARRNPIDTSGVIHRPAVDVTKPARFAGIKTDPREAIWWIATELRVLNEQEGDAAVRSSLEELFAYRWRHYRETQALPELARQRHREGLMSW